MADATEVIRDYPKRAEGYNLRAGLYNVKRDYQKAIADANRAIQVDPGDIAACIDAYCTLGFAHLRLKAYGQAVLDFKAGLKLDPKDKDVLNSLAWLLATCPDSTVRNGGKATEYISRALQRDPNQWKLWDTRTAVFAENGDFGNAVLWEERCLERKDLSEVDQGRVRERLALYRARKPYREEPKPSDSRDLTIR